MGMFDYLRCDYSLPDSACAQTLQFQTKDTPAQGMDQYELRYNGTLWHHERRWRVTTQRWIPVAWQRVDYTGLLNFYEYDDQHTPKVWWEYEAMFVRNRCVTITGGGTNEGSDLEQALWKVRHAKD